MIIRILRKHCNIHGTANLGSLLKRPPEEACEEASEEASEELLKMLPRSSSEGSCSGDPQEKSFSQRVNVLRPL